MRQWAAAADDADPDDDPDEPADALHLSETLDGRRELRGHLSPDSAVEVEQALAHAAVDDPDVPMSVRNANALVEIASSRITTSPSRPTVEAGGPTVIMNLVMLCSKHHHLLHKTRWTAVLEPDGTLHITGPDGETRTTHPACATRCGRPAATTGEAGVRAHLPVGTRRQGASPRPSPFGVRARVV
jgi:hypothetical protein